MHYLPFLLIIFLLCQHGSATTNLSNQTDLLALLEFKNQISNDPFNFFNSWNDSVHFCQWRGVKCGKQHQRVTGLNLHSQNLLGTISPHIGNLSFLRFIDFKNNSFHGIIPQEISQLSRLRNLILNNNTLLGHIPVNLSRCVNLRYMFLSYNELVGQVPDELGSFKMLDSLMLETNHFTGVIPRSLGNLSSLTQISFQRNNVKGKIPNELGQLTKLTFFSFGMNTLSGTIPSALYNISTISMFSLVSNNFSGTLPPQVGLTLPNLKKFLVGDNNFHGEIPVSFSNASQLRFLDIPDNRFTGQVPSNFGFLQNLQLLGAWGNLLGSNSTNDLSFITSLSNCSDFRILSLQQNNFGGEMPRSIGNLSVQLEFLLLSENHITGIIPSVLENLVNLYFLALGGNLLSGTIPSSLGKLVKLQVLQLYGNKLSGQLPSSLGNNTGLSELILSENKLEGNIPESIGNCEKLNYLDLSENCFNGSIPKKVISIFSISKVLDLSGNFLTGTLPVEVGTLKNINQLDVSNNMLTGNIPTSIGQCLSLEYLNLSRNNFSDQIPWALASLRGIRTLDLSRNNLSGLIPKAMEDLPYLHYLNLSFNKLEGEVSKNGVFGNASEVSVEENSKLCGGIKEMQLPSCRITSRKPIVVRTWQIVISACGGIFVLVSIISIVFLRRKSRKGPSSTDTKVDKLLRISYEELYRATEGFSQRNLIGSGSFGSVYQGKLNEDDKLVAVKVLNLEKNGASKSFTAECRALRNIRHRNLVKIKTYCSSIDSKRNPFKALVYEFMSHGSLDMWLHPQVHERSGRLFLLQRVNIVIDVANAIHYLHDLCEPPIIHCDLKPSNILLDNELIAHVGDFGLAKLLSKSVDNFAEAESSSMGIMGSIGYAPPEYRLGGEASKYGDVYSFGVLLLELLTGKRPTDDMFKDGQNLHKYALTALEQEDFMKIVDPTLVKIGETETGAPLADEEREYGDDIVVEQQNSEIGGLMCGKDEIEKCITGLFEIGVRCSKESPKERLAMENVVKELHHIRIAFIGENKAYSKKGTGHTTLQITHQVYAFPPPFFFYNFSCFY